MFGSIFYNFWAALIGFSIYFFSTLSDNSMPLNSLVGSSIAAVVSFLFMYAIRLLLGYVLYTPEDELFNRLNKENEQLREHFEKSVSGASDAGAGQSTVDFNDQNSEEIAKVVQTMMLQDDPAKK